MQDRGHLLTEQLNHNSRTIDQMTPAEAFDVMNGEDQAVARAVADAKADIVKAIELVVAAFKGGGRLIYVGAGTSGRLGVIDASECPPTFLTDPEMVQGIISGGMDAMFRSIEKAEDSREGGAAIIVERKVGPNDVVFGIAAGGTTPYVHGAIAQAKALGAKTVFFACVTREQCADEADVSIRVLSGPEVITGSTRLKAGTVTKLTLNMITTLSMVQLGKVYGNLMVDVNSNACSKLVDRGARIIGLATGVDRDEAFKLLERANGWVKAAIVMHHKGLDVAQANELLQSHDGNVRSVLES